MEYPDPISARNHFRFLSFQELKGRLVTYVITRIRNGEFTERGLARVLGVSQPQLHNVLKGARPLKADFADRLLRQFDIGVLDLMEQWELRLHLRAHDVAAEEDWGKAPVEAGRKPVQRVSPPAQGRARLAS